MFTLPRSIGDGPLLKASAELREKLTELREGGQIGGYRLGAVTRTARGREVEVIFASESDAMLAKLST